MPPLKLSRSIGIAPAFPDETAGAGTREPKARDTGEHISTGNGTPQWLIIHGRLEGADFAPLGAVTVAPRFEEVLQQPHPAGCLKRA